MERDPLARSPRWERLDRADDVLVLRDRESGSTMTRVRRVGGGSRSHEGTWVLLSAHLQLLAIFECDAADEGLPWERAELAIRNACLQAEEEWRGPSAVDFSEVYSFSVES